jgi:DNA primase
VFIAYDRDEAGDRAATKLGARLVAEGFEVLRVVFPLGMDDRRSARGPIWFRHQAHAVSST